MISFAQNFSKYNQRALKAAALSTIPGLGQLFNRRLDKAIAFFLVNLANIALVAVLLGYRFPIYGFESATLSAQLQTWRAGTVPFFIIQLMMLGYIIYSQWDAYRDAAASTEADSSWKINLKQLVLCLSLSTCASYVMHMGVFFLIGFLILFKICPEIKPPEVPQITLQFELETPQEDKADVANEGKVGQESDQDTDAHLKEKPKEDLIQASTKSAEMSADTEEDRPDMKLAAKETAAVASKEILTPDAKQIPQESASQGAVEDAKQTTKQANEQTKPQEIAKPPQQLEKLPTETAKQNPPEQENPFNNFVKPKLIAQLPPTSVTQPVAVPSQPAQSATSDPEQVAITMPVSTPPVRPWQDTSHSPNPVAPYGVQVDPTSQSPDTLPQGTQTDTPEGPSMLGFMDSTLSNDVDMRALWAEMSGNISRHVKANPLKGQGLAMASFTLDRTGRPVMMQTAPQSELSNSLSNALRTMPTVVPPANHEGGMYFQVKASNDGKATFISLEVNSTPSPTSEEALSDFKYQTDLQVYLKGIKKSVYSAWKPPVQEGIKPVMVGFKVSTNGRISNQHVVQSSGDPKMDRAALNAALSVTKWSQPPAGTSEDMDVCMVLQRCKNCEGEAKKKATTSALPYVGLNTSINTSANQTILQSGGTSGYNPSLPYSGQKAPRRSDAPSAWGYPQ